MSTEQDPNDADGRIIVHNMLEEGDYVTRNRYTPDQQEEIRVMLRESARAAARELNPALAHVYDVTRV